MPHLPENARLWLERAEIDYIGPFVKAWASFNAWYREASGQGRDLEGLRYVKHQANPVTKRDHAAPTGGTTRWPRKPVAG